MRDEGMRHDRTRWRLSYREALSLCAGLWLVLGGVLLAQI